MIASHYSPNTSSSSPSSPVPGSIRFWHSTGNASRILLHRSSLINRPECLRAQLLIRRRHIGQDKFDCSTFCRKHGIQSSWLQGMVTGSTKIHRQIGHMHSDNLKDAILFLFPCKTPLKSVDHGLSQQVAINGEARGQFVCRIQYG